MTKIISFSVWGNNSKYLNGSLENIYLAKEIYPGWVCRFYCDSKVNHDFISSLEKADAQVIIKNTQKNNWEGLFWRFAPASEPDIDVFISRDIDSRLNEREKAAVEEWLNSDKLMHCMRDHVEHNVPMLGGMWGCKKGLILDINGMIKSWDKCDYKGSDQDFLKSKVWETYSHTALVHDRFYNGFVVEQIVSNIEEYRKQRKEQQECREKTLFAKAEYISNAKFLGVEVDQKEVEKLFPEVPEVTPEKTNSKGQVVFDYIYNPIAFFGPHDVRPFPVHKPMKHGIHVGEIIE